MLLLPSEWRYRCTLGLILLSSHEFGPACDEALEHSGIRIAHIFSRDSTNQRTRKLVFHPGDGPVPTSRSRSSFVCDCVGAGPPRSHVVTVLSCRDISVTSGQ